MLTTLIAAALLSSGHAANPSRAYPQHPKSADPIWHETAAQKNRRMAWWREARFGMFIHWGLYAIAGGHWNGKPVEGAGEWLLTNAQIPVADYEPLRDKFNPVKFNARKWVQIAKQAGMRYIVITSKHHEGFGLWPSKQGDWNIGFTPFHRDVLKELAVACRAEKMRLCFYHSIMDWHHPDYLPRRPWDHRDASHADFERYVAYMKAQLKELLTNYGDIGILWFDGEWESTWTHERGKDLYAYVRTLQPKIIVNNRVDTGRNGMAGGTASGDFAGDYGTPEQTIPANGLPGTDWESCMTMNDTWGFKIDDHNWKSATTLIENLVDCASKGGNYLLNVGPTPEGEIPAPSVERLAEVGKWMDKNHDAIYGTFASPFPRPLPWGRVTQKPKRLFLHVFDVNATAVQLTGLNTKLDDVHPLGDPDIHLAVFPGDKGPTVYLPPPDGKTIRVIEADFSDPISVAPYTLAQNPDGSITLGAADAQIQGDTVQYEAAKNCIGYWTNLSDSISWTFEVKRPGRNHVLVELACEPGSAGATYEVDIAGQKFAGTVPATAGWTSFRTVNLGTVEIASTAQIDVKVVATSKPGLAVMNLRSVKLGPTE